MTNIEQAARAEAWEKFYEPGMGQRESRAFQAGWAMRAEYLLSDENVEKAARGMVEAGPIPWENCGQATRNEYRNLARAALRAVLSEGEPQ